MKKGIKFLIGISICLLIIDFISTIINTELVQYLEINPLVGKIGIWGIFLLNSLFIVGLYLWYTKSKKVFYRFTVINILVFIAFIRIFAIQNNFEVYNDPPTIEQAQQVTPEMKAQTMKKVVAPILFPYLLALISFMFFQIDHKIEGKWNSE